MLGIVLAVASTAIFQVFRSPHGRIVLELCTVPTTHYSVILSEYNGYVKVYRDGIKAQLVGILIKQSELVIYVLIFRQSLFCALLQ